MSRLFFALWPDDALRGALEHSVRKAVRASGGRPMPAQNLHVTLAFLGSVPEQRIPDLTSIARRIAVAFPAEAAPIAITLDRIEHWKKAQLICALSDDNPAGAITLAEALKTGTAAAGFAPDLKPFRVHVTVARKVLRPTRSLDMHSVRWDFTSFALVESRTEPEGSAYSVVESYALAGEQPSNLQKGLK